MASYCDICCIQLPQGSVESHLLGKRHKKALSFNQQQQQQSERSIFIPKLPPCATPNELKRYLSQFGPVQDLHITTKGFAFVEFRSRDVVAAILGYPCHALGGSRFHVLPKINKKFTGPPKGPPGQVGSKAEEVLIDHKDIEQDLEGTSDVDHQMNLLRSYVLMKKKDLDVRKDVLQEIKEVVERHIPGVEVHAFGSSANGFGFRGSDIDVFVDLCLDKVPPIHQKQMSCPRLPYLLDLEGVTVVGGRVTKASLKKLSLIQRAKFVSRTLKQHKEKFVEIFVIPSQRCPVVRCVHMPSRVKCDITVSSSLGVRNTEMIRLLSHMDSRFTELMPTIRYWAKLFKVAGSVTSAPIFTNYCLVLLVIFYLQQGEQPVLPSIEELAKLADSPTVIDDWDCSMPTDPSVWKHNICSRTSEDLLQGFFEFYANLDFSSSVLCLRSGQRRDLAEFRASLTGVPQMEAFKISYINIQDPFVLSHNTSFSVNEKWSKSISESFSLAASRCKAKEFSSGKAPWGLLLLLAPDSSPSHPPPQAATKHTSTAACHREFPFSIVFSSMPGDKACQGTWVKEVMNAVRTVLVDVMACKWDVKFDRVRDMLVDVPGSLKEDEAMDSACEPDTLEHRGSSFKNTEDACLDDKEDSTFVNSESSTSDCDTARTGQVAHSAEDAEMVNKVDLDEVKDSCDLDSSSSQGQTSQTADIPTQGEKRKRDQMDTEDSKKVCLANRTNPTSKDDALLDVVCESYCRMWHGRRQAQKRFKTSSSFDPKLNDTLSFEKQVTHYMQSNNLHNPSKLVTLAIQLAFTFDLHSLTIHMLPLSNKKEFPNIYQLMKTLITKCVLEAGHKNI